MDTKLLLLLLCLFSSLAFGNPPWDLPADLSTIPCEIVVGENAIVVGAIANMSVAKKANRYQVNGRVYTDGPADHTLWDSLTHQPLLPRGKHSLLQVIPDICTDIPVVGQTMTLVHESEVPKSAKRFTDKETGNEYALLIDDRLAFSEWALIDKPTNKLRIAGVKPDADVPINEKRYLIDNRLYYVVAKPHGGPMEIAYLIDETAPSAKKVAKGKGDFLYQNLETNSDSSVSYTRRHTGSNEKIDMNLYTIRSTTPVENGKLESRLGFKKYYRVQLGFRFHDERPELSPDAPEWILAIVPLHDYEDGDNVLLMGFDHVYLLNITTAKIMKTYAYGEDSKEWFNGLKLRDGIIDSHSTALGVSYGTISAKNVEVILKNRASSETRYLNLVVQ